MLLKANEGKFSIFLLNIVEKTIVMMIMTKSGFKILQRYPRILLRYFNFRSLLTSCISRSLYCQKVSILYCQAFMSCLYLLVIIFLVQLHDYVESFYICRIAWSADIVFHLHETDSSQDMPHTFSRAFCKSPDRYQTAFD